MIGKPDVNISKPYNNTIQVLKLEFGVMHSQPQQLNLRFHRFLSTEQMKQDKALGATIKLTKALYYKVLNFYRSYLELNL